MNESIYKQGEQVAVPLLGIVKISKARKGGLCYGWIKHGRHQIEKGDLFIYTEPSDTSSNPFAMKRCCLSCAGIMDTK